MNLITFLEIQADLKTFTDLQSNTLYQTHIKSIAEIISYLEKNDNLETIPYDLIKKLSNLFSDPDRVGLHHYDDYLRRKITPLILQISEARNSAISSKLQEQIKSIVLDESFEERINSILAFCKDMLERKYSSHTLIHNSLVIAKQKFEFSEKQWEFYRDELLNKIKPPRFGTVQVTETAGSRGFTVQYKLARTHHGSQSAREHPSPKLVFAARSRAMSSPVIPVMPVHSEQDELCVKMNNLKLKQ